MATGLAILSVLLLAAFFWGRFWPLRLTVDEIAEIAGRPVHEVVFASYEAWRGAGWGRRLLCIIAGIHYRVEDMDRVFWITTFGRTQMLVAAWGRR